MKKKNAWFTEIKRKERIERQCAKSLKMRKECAFGRETEKAFAKAIEEDEWLESKRQQ